MSLYYHTDFGFGRRGRRIRRVYTGVWAIVAIIADLCFMMTLELTLALLVLALRCALSIIVALAYLLAVPLRVIRWTSGRLGSWLSGPAIANGSLVSKPAWDGLAEI